MKETLSPQGRRLANIINKKAKRYNLSFVNQTFNAIVVDNKIICHRKCGCALVVGAHNSKALRLGLYASLQEHYNKLNFSTQYIGGIMNGFDDTKKETNFYYSTNDYILGYHDGWVLQQRLIKKINS